MTPDGAKNGWGVYYYLNQIQIGWWLDNQMNGNGKIYDGNGQLYEEGWYINGECVKVNDKKNQQFKYFKMNNCFKDYKQPQIIEDDDQEVYYDE